MATKLAPEEISGLDPYKFTAVIGRRVIHPGGRASTETLLRQAQITGSAKVLDVGCGVATTAIETRPPPRRAGHRGGHLTADAGARPGQRPRRGLADLVTVTSADILALPFDDAAVDVAVAEAVTRFTDRPKAAYELAR